MHAIEIEDLSVSFEDEVVLETLSFTLEQGEKLAVTGESGSGKSTLLNVLTGFVIPQAGTVRIFGNLLHPDNIAAIRSSTAWLPQELNFPVNTVREMFLLPFGYSRNKTLLPSEAVTVKLFNQLGLNVELLNKLTQEISGGQKQRILIAASYCLKKPLMILDEPTSALDSASKRKVMELLYNERELTLIAVTHDQEWISAADKTLYL